MATFRFYRESLGRHLLATSRSWELRVALYSLGAWEAVTALHPPSRPGWGLGSGTHSLPAFLSTLVS